MIELYKDKKVKKAIFENKTMEEPGVITLNPNQIILSKIIKEGETEDGVEKSE